MNRLFLVISPCILLLSGLGAQEKDLVPIYKNPKAAVEDRMADLLSRLTLEEKIDMLGGVEGFYIRPNERLGIPKIKMSDGPLGVRNYGEATAFPAGMALAATWNPGLMSKVGEMVGREARSKGVHIMLSPGLNIHRAPMCGRNFEYFGEDPWLAGRMAVAYVQGVQSQGVVATVKHFAANNQEYGRHQVSSDMDERTLQEIYLPAFRAAVVQGKAGAVMSAYNLLNGVYCSNNAHLLNDILKGQWKFDGFVMSDWGAVHDGLASVEAGLDLEMPSGKFLNRETILPALQAGRLEQSAIDDKIRRLLRIMFRFGFFDRHQVDRTIPLYPAESRKVALQAAREGIVLLKNEGGLLPLDRAAKKTIAVIGPAAYPAVTGGGGSSRVTPFQAVSFLEGIAWAAGEKIKVLYHPGIAIASSLRKDSTPDPQLIEESRKIASLAEAVILCLGFNQATEQEGEDRPFELPPDQRMLLEEVAGLNRNVIVVLIAGGNVKMADWLDRVKAVIHTWYPGQEGGTALAEILFGDVNPSGKLPVSFEKRWEDNAAYGSYYDDDQDNRVRYAEGIFLGYRHFDRNKIAPLFPFGYGLSYTTFEYSNLSVSTAQTSPGQIIKVSFEVKNTGMREGAEIAQLYIRDVESSEPRAVKELKGLAKVFLIPGQMKTIEIELGEDDLSFYSADKNGWLAEPGEFEVMVGSSSADIKLRTQFTLQ
jgi:beta-glucosidase